MRSWSEPSRISCRCCSLGRRAGARRTGSRRRRSAMRRRPATSSTWRGWSSSAPRRLRERSCRDRRTLARAGWRRTEHWSERGGRRARRTARRALGPAGGGERWADAAERASYEGALPDGSASIDSWRALLRAQRCRRGAGEDARRCGARGPNARPLEPPSAERPAAARDLALAGRRARRRPTTCSPTSPRRASSSERSTPSRSRWASAPRSRSRVARGSRPRSSPTRRSGSSAGHRMEEYPTSALAFAVAARVALHRGDTAGAEELLTRAQRLRPAAHVRAAVLRRPDPLGARAGLHDDRRRRRRGDDAARDRRAVAPPTGPRRRSRPRPRSCAPA